MLMRWSCERCMTGSVCFKGDSGSVDRIITDDMRASAEVSAAQWNDYQDRFAPFEQKFMDDVLRDTKDTQNKIQGQTNADVMQAMASKTGPVAGFDPSRGSTVSTSAIAKGLSTGMTQAQAAVGNQQVNNMNTVIGMGRGQAIDSVGTMSDLASVSGDVALKRAEADATSSMNERGANMSMIGAGLGAASAIGNNYMQTGSFFGTGTSAGESLKSQPAATMTALPGTKADTGGNGLYLGSNDKTYLLTGAGRYVPYK